MKNLVLLLVAIISASAFAATGSQSTMKQDSSETYSDDISQGFRIDLAKSFFNAKISSEGDSVSGEAKQNIGVGLGYAAIHPMNVGWMADIQYDSYQGGAAIPRLEGDVNFGFERIGYVFGGLNVSTITNAGNGVTVNPGVGFQLGIGANFVKAFGADFAYVMMNQSVHGDDGSSGDVTLSGIEIRLHATFKEIIGESDDVFGHLDHP